MEIQVEISKPKKSNLKVIRQETTYVENKEHCPLNQIDISAYKFRIMQVGDKKFYVQKLFKETRTKGYLWWKKTETIEDWKRVDTQGRRLLIRRYYSNIDLLKTYKTLGKAKKWIEEYGEYPIYH